MLTPDDITAQAYLCEMFACIAGAVQLVLLYSAAGCHTDSLRPVWMFVDFAVQVQYSLLYRRPETNGVFEACKENGVTLVAYSPLCQGLLTGGT